MRKRLSVAVAAMILACAISPAAVWAEEPPTTETPAVTNEESAMVAKINGQSYDSLQAAIDGAKDGQEIVLQSNVALTTGLKFSGEADAPKNFIINANGKNLTLTGLGMHATFCNVTIKNCQELTISASMNPGENEGVTANYFGKASLVLDSCDKVIISNDNQNPCGSGLCIYDGGDLYIQNNTHFTVKGFMDNSASGIYMDREDGDYRSVKGNIEVSGYSTLEATNCYHSGITANPVAITIRDHSELNVHHNNNKDGSGEGGLSSYFGKLSVEGYSRVVSQKNTAMQYSIYVHDLYVDGTSEIDASYNGLCTNVNLGGHGLAFSGTGILESGAKVTATGNWGPGVDVAHYHEIDEKTGFDYDYKGSLIVNNGATISACRNYNRGLANEGELTINSGANVYLNENLEGGLDNYPKATATVENGANLVITGNGMYGIKNGNAGFGDGSEAKLTLGSGTITDNNKASNIPYHEGGALVVPYHWNCGGGICNENGEVTVSTSAVICNNKANNAGDDLYNYEDIPEYNLSGNIFNITQLVPGAKWCVLDDDQKIIDDWYKDYAGTDNRWRIDNAINNTDIELSPGAALKAAHGAVAPTPSPSPSPEPTSTPDQTDAPVPTNEPSPVPSASPVPSTPMPSAVPTAAPTAAPTEAPVQPTTAPVAPVTRVDATATPAPTDAPTQQPTTAPAATAQPATATIPQTGDAAPLALFGGLTISSAAAFYFLRKRRKSE